MGRGKKNTIIMLYSLLIDRKIWMESEYSNIKDKPLWQVTLPGSHDSGAYDMELEHASGSGTSAVPAFLARPFAETHEDDMADQLAGGARYFDVRPYNKSGTYYAWHSLIGDGIINMLNDTREFLETTNNELVILKFSHFCEFDNDSVHQDFINLVKSKLGNYIYKNNNSSKQLLTTTIGQFVGNGSKVIIWYNNNYISSNPEDGFFRTIYLVNSYSNTDNFNSMRSDQLAKLYKNPSSVTQMFGLSWTLTPQADISGIYTSLHDLTYDANRYLGEFLADYGKKGCGISIVYSDFLPDARTTDCSIMLNR